jgi:hypothetical protein
VVVLFKCLYDSYSLEDAKAGQYLVSNLYNPIQICVNYALFFNAVTENSQRFISCKQSSIVSLPDELLERDQNQTK